LEIEKHRVRSASNTICFYLLDPNACRECEKSLLTSTVHPSERDFIAPEFAFIRLQIVSKYQLSFAHVKVGLKTIALNISTFSATKNAHPLGLNITENSGYFPPQKQGKFQGFKFYTSFLPIFDPSMFGTVCFYP
jgi:hypothetical protein